MDETKEVNAQADVATQADELIAKKVYDDTVAAYDTKIENLQKENEILKKQVGDYSTVLRNLNVQGSKEPEKNSDELVTKLFGGI